MIRLALMLFFLVGCNLQTHAHAREAVPIADMKAAYLYNFILYAKWPSNLQTINLCLYKQASATVNVKLLETKRDQQINLTVLNDMKNAAACQVLYVDESNSAELQALNATLANTPTLLITNAAQPVAKTSMIQLQVEKGFLIFNVNLKAVRLANIQLSAKVLQLAKEVASD